MLGLGGKGREWARGGRTREHVAGQEVALVGGVLLSDRDAACFDGGSAMRLCSIAARLRVRRR